MYAFNYQRAASLDEAQKLLSASEDGTVMAGGQTLIPTLKQRLAQPSDIIDIGHISDLNGISVDGAAVTIGAGTKHADVADSPDVRKAIPALADLAGMIGDPAVRHMGTLGGSIANNDPSADYPAACIGLEATVHTTAGEIPADGFFKGMFETALEDGDIITKVSFPVAKRAAYVKFPNPASRYAMVGVFVAEIADGIRVAVTGAGASVFRVPDMEKALAKNFAPEAVAGIAVSPEGLNADIHGSAAYRAHLITVMAKRAVTKALG